MSNVTSLRDVERVEDDFFEEDDFEDLCYSVRNRNNYEDDDTSLMHPNESWEEFMEHEDFY